MAKSVARRHAGFNSREVCADTSIGWGTNFERLTESREP